ncbi:uncharacterized protein SGFS_085410 [Streptomyces graminofaciens]|uniref:Small hydrophilic protein n=1 Tax=Streptomyces graminofaciens TaxID=68212 RepID=A0ABM7FLQ4_9ACTN|nr:hypothetical protein [Streptomyces graminofaciens]BBC37247.1 uncharacterized protein SGFS_085410 [Streptomyces graminofaciens]
MAKNKKQDRKQPQSERGQQQAQQSSLESQTEHRGAQVTPGDMARKGRQKRFGHN